MDVSDINSAIAIILFLMPGFVADWTMSLFIPKSGFGDRQMILRYLTLSSLSYALGIPLIALFNFMNWLQGWTLFVLAFALIFVLPVAIGLIVSYGYYHRSLNSLLLKVSGAFNLRPLPSMPNAWDDVFFRISQSEGVWLIVALKDGEFFGGWFGGKSFASTNPEDRDIYIEKIFQIDKSGAWHDTTRPTGILVKLDNVKHIQVIEDSGGG
jgi:hypothetical protein